MAVLLKTIRLTKLRIGAESPDEPYDEDLESLLAAMPEEAAAKVRRGCSGDDYG